MDGRELVRSMREAGPVPSLAGARTAWRHRRTDARALPPRLAERARVPGRVRGAEPGPGGGTVRFARAELHIRVAVGGAVFWGWDGARPEPSYALAGPAPEPDPRAVLEPDTDGGWRVVSERLTVAVSREGGVEVRTPGGVTLRRDLPPRWWEAADGTGARWSQRSQVAADARFFGLGGRASGLLLRDGVYGLWNGAPRPSVKQDAARLTMPVQLVVADGGTHLAFHDNTWEGRLTLREGREGAGSGHDRPGTSELRVEGGPLRCWVMAGTPTRVLHCWTQLTGAPVPPPAWALGPQLAHRGPGGEREVRRVVAGYREHGLPPAAVHLDAGRPERRRGSAVEGGRYSDLPALAEELRAQGTRLVSVVEPAVRVDPGDPVYAAGSASGAFVRDPAGREVRAAARASLSAYPDFTSPPVRAWWGGLYEEYLAQGFGGVFHEGNEPATLAPFGGRTLPRSARHALEGRGGDHHEAHNVYGLAMARAGFEALGRLRPDERPFSFSRSGWAGMQRYGGTWWDEDPGGWEGLRAALALVLGLGLSGVPYSGPDVGGFGNGEPDELVLRRLQLAAHLPLLRLCGPFVERPGRPSGAGGEVLGHARTALAERERLMPYLVTLVQLAGLTGAPCVRPVWWNRPQDRDLRACEDAFLLGDALLVAPVLEEGARRRFVRLPRGRWYDVADERAYEGPGQVRIAAPLSRVPVLARAGSVLPVRDERGGIALEVWAPAPGRTGGGLVVRDPGDGWKEPATERYATRLQGGEVRVARVTEEGGEPPQWPVLVRGAGR
ncbi:glycoside hydrolase family 31 protein [Streptomyces fuscigenes]|uniref:glycoside hydrolase family 31 protein n=1 Tax=Streptomyces fuscigenes TaxID=1528880 RepID=UPI001F1E2386|nr:glycoside hydrolase family 31 protein [Streptomyces fuscigenes]MCF3963034.1 glycoside hydrolase family 31 protein [Streptomyces fuscigenes]